MKIIKPFLFISLAVISCAHEGNIENTETISTEKQKELITPTDHIVDLCDYLFEHPIKNSISKETITDHFQIEKTLIDSINFDNSLLKRTFIVEENTLIGVKFSLYSDSIASFDVEIQINQIASYLTTKMGLAPISTLYTHYWTYHEMAFRLKIYPNEGFDLIVSRESGLNNISSCVGDWTSVKDQTTAIIDSLISGIVLNPQHITKEFSGIIFSFKNQEINIEYTCLVSLKLIEIDKKTLISDVNTLLSKSPIEKDGMLFWEHDKLTLQMISTNTGFSIKLII